MSDQDLPDELIWAKEVLEVYRAQGSLPGSRKWSSSSAQHMFENLKDEKVYLAFIKDLVPKATAILSKNTLMDASDAVLEIDSKTIGDLKQLLAKAVATSQKDAKAEPELEQMKEKLQPAPEKPQPSIEDLF